MYSERLGKLSLINKRYYALLCCAIWVFSLFVAYPEALSAQEVGSVVGDVSPTTLSMTLTPPLYQLALAPGATWASTLRFRNGNAYPLTMHAIVQNFRASKSLGVEFFGSTEASEGRNIHELASWIAYSPDDILVPPYTTVDIPFAVTIPEGAEPGGHYAAILMSSEDAGAHGAADITVSSTLTSLILVRVAGDVLEDGHIEEFAPDTWFSGTQKTLLHLRFVNTGNVHIEPTGYIDIINMFGRTRGRIIMEESQNFGNILPNATKTFSFVWKGEKNFADIGLYRARASLVYGENKEKTSYYTTYFFVFPWLPTVSILGFVTLFAWFVRRGIVYYVANAVAEENKKLTHQSPVDVSRREPTTLSLAILRQPIIDGLRDCSPRLRTLESQSSTLKFLRGRFKKYYAFFVFMLVVAVGLGFIEWYFYQVFESERQFEVIIKNDNR